MKLVKTKVVYKEAVESKKNIGIIMWLKVAFFSFLFVGCATLKEPVPVEHVVMFNGNGAPVDPTGDTGCTRQETKDIDLNGYSFYKPCLGSHSYNPASDYKELSPGAYKDYLKQMFQKLEGFYDPNKKTNKILLFFHGGLNKQVGSLERITQQIKYGEGFNLRPSEELECKTPANLTSGSENSDKRYCQIMADGYFPIFVNWHSSFFSTYKDHLFGVRQGEARNGGAPFKKAWTVLTSPLYLAIDLVRGIVRAPVVLGSQWAADIGSLPKVSSVFDDFSPDYVSVDILCREKYPNIESNEQLKVCLQDPQKEFPKIFWGLEKEELEFNNERAQDDSKLPKFSLEADTKTDFEMITGAASYAYSFPTKVILPPFIDAFGSSSWANMLRRVNLLYNTDDEFHSDLDRNWSGQARKDLGQGLARTPDSGGLSRFLNSLVNHIKKNENLKKWEITLVGHSMGTIVMNELLRKYRDKLNVKNIVYMAGASSFRDFETSVLPYLKKDKDIKFYNLMLHRKAELRESNYFDLTPRGSLLLWIDDYLARPDTHEDRTVGRYDNFMVSFHKIPPGLRKQVTIKVFGAGSGKPEIPQKHGDFSSDFRFWDESCWEKYDKKTNQGSPEYCTVQELK
jgi:pimeloyl-ACP methyl ester carboxylesterase